MLFYLCLCNFFEIYQSNFPIFSKKNLTHGQHNQTMWGIFLPSNAQASHKIMHYLSLCALYLQDQHFQLKQNVSTKMCNLYYFLNDLCSIAFNLFFSFSSHLILFSYPHTWILGKKINICLFMSTRFIYLSIYLTFQ